MSASYGWINLVSSFGFSWWWRQQCVKALSLEPEMHVYDLMSGMGEVWGALAKNLSPLGRVSAVDFSEGMMRGAAKQVKYYAHQTNLIQADLLDQSLPWQPADAVVSCFGLKTFSKAQQAEFAQKLSQFLKPGAGFSLIEISVPDFLPLRWVYMFYLKKMIPLIGRILLGNPDHYRLLGIYTERFGNARFFYECLLDQGLEVKYHRYFGGCASGVVGYKAQHE